MWFIFNRLSILAKNPENRDRDRFRKFKVCFEPNRSFGTKSELLAKLRDEKWTFFSIVSCHL
jgi:hypothetical protein